MQLAEQQIISNLNRAKRREHKLYRAMYPELYGPSGMAICRAVRLHALTLDAVAKWTRALNDYRREHKS